MTLGRRLARQRSGSATTRAAARAPDPLSELKELTRETLARDLGKKLGGSDHDGDELKALVATELARVMTDSTRLLTDDEREALLTSVIDDVLGYGPIEPLLADPTISEVMVNGTDAIYVERSGRIELTKRRYRSDDHVKQVIIRIAGAVGRRVDESSPMVDARLADGSRVNAVIPPLAVDGPVLTIRKFAADTLGPRDLLAKGSLTPPALHLLAAAVKGHLNILVSGGTGTGKTTFLNVLSGFIPPEDRIVTIEDAVELSLRQRHVIRLETRPANIEGRGAVSTRDLMRNCLRMRPDRIIVGECRGPEALDMLQAMNTGHDGSLGTLHANTPDDALGRLETMVLMAGLDLPTSVVRTQLASAIDLIVQLERLRDGSRVVASISEVLDVEDGEVKLNPLFARRYDESEGASGSELLATGSDPTFGQKLARHGVSLAGRGAG